MKHQWILPIALALLAGAAWWMADVPDVRRIPTPPAVTGLPLAVLPPSEAPALPEPAPSTSPSSSPPASPPNQPSPEPTPDTAAWRASVLEKLQGPHLIRRKSPSRESPLEAIERTADLLELAEPRRSWFVSEAGGALGDLDLVYKAAVEDYRIDFKSSRYEARWAEAMSSAQRRVALILEGGDQRQRAFIADLGTWWDLVGFNRWNRPYEKSWRG